MKKVGVGLIGCGGRLRDVARRVTGVSDAIEVVGLCDPQDRSIAAARALFGPDVPSYAGAGELCAAPDVDWVMVGSWNSQHREHVEAAFRAGKHVFCEKPLATTFEDCLAMRDAWIKSGRLFSIGFTLRYSPHYRKIRELLDQERIGKLISMEFNETIDFNHGGFIHGDWRRNRRNAGSHILEKCCHDIDLANWMVGCRAARVASFGGTGIFRPENEYLIKKVGKDVNGREAFRTWHTPECLNPFVGEKDIVDNQVVILEYEDGVRATFHTNCSTAMPERRMYLCGTEGTMRADVITGSIELRRIGFGTEVEHYDTEGRGGHGGGDETLSRSVADSMLNDAPPFTGLEHGLASAVTCFAIDEALDTGTVIDVRPCWARIDGATETQMMKGRDASNG